MRVIHRSGKTAFLLFAIMVCACRSQAENTFVDARTANVEGQAPGAETAVEVEVSAASMLPNAKCCYTATVHGGQYSQPVKLFPGNNLVTSKTSSGAHEQFMTFYVSKPSIRVELRCTCSNYRMSVNQSWCGNNGSISFTDAPAGKYGILVHNYWEAGGPFFSAVPATVSVYVNEELVCRKTNSDGKFLWSAGTVIVHSGDQAGGYAVDGGRRLDITDQGAVRGLSANDEYLNNYASWGFVDYAVTDFSGPDGGNPVYMPVGAAAQFSASGTVYQYYSGSDQNVSFIDCFTSADESVGTVDGLGVFVAKAPGHTQVSCAKCSGDPIDVYVVQTGITVDADLDDDVDADDEAQMAARASPYRWSLPVATNVFRPVRLDTGVAASGSLGLTLAGDAAFRVWATASPGPSDQPILDLPGGGVDGEDLGIVLPYTGSTTLYVEAVSNGTATLTYTFAGSGTAAGATFSTAVQLAAWDIGIATDYDRDGTVSAADFKRTLTNEVFRFWVNDDKDGGDVAADGSDVPGQADGNFSDDVVNGRCDLADFFPVCLNVAALFGATGLDPLTVSARLRQADGAVNAVWTGLAPEDAGMFQRSDVGTCGEFCTSLGYSAASVQVTPGGVTLPPAFLLTTLFHGSNGVVMVEGRKPTAKPLVLELLSQGSVVCRASLPLSISSVESMYRCVNLRNMTNQGPLPEPSNNPDAISNGKNLVFLHGYQPASEADPSVHDWHKAWLAEMFKRFYWSGSRAKFHGVVWRSDGGDAMDYQKNVTNAFCTAPVLKDYVAVLNGDVIVAAHSLGNMVVSSAIVDHNMSVSKYMMCDAAVASEAYDSAVTQEANLRNVWWADYSNRTWVANWHQLFSGTGDSRENLTWRDRFADVVSATEAWNFRSTGDEVFSLTVNPGLLSGSVEIGYWGIIPISVNINFGRYSWQKQELFKGIRYSDGWPSFGGTAEAGWGFETAIQAQTVGDEEQFSVIPVYTNSAGANAASNNDLRNNPVFKHTPSWLVGTNTLLQGQIDFMLGMGIPALTPSTGRTQLPLYVIPVDRQKDLNSLPDTGFKPNGWPNRADPDGQNWLHNDMKDVAYFYAYLLFDTITVEGNLK